MLTITNRTEGDVAVLAVRGTITAGEPCDTLHDAVRGRLRRGARKLVLDLAEATTGSDPAGVSALLDARLAGLEVGAEIVLANLTTRVDDMLILVALMRYFDAFDSTEQALERFGRRRLQPADDSGALDAQVRAA